MKVSRPRLFALLVLVLVFGLLLSACGGEEPTPEPPPATNTPVPTNTPAPTSTPEPTATPDVTAGFVDFESEVGGFTLSYPGDWFTSDFLVFTVLASNEELLDSPDPGEEGGAALVVAGSSEELGITKPADSMGTILDQFDLANEVEFVSGPTATTINGQEAGTAVFSGVSDNDTPITAYVAIITNEDRVVVFISVTPSESQEQYLPVFEAIANTIEVGQPTEVAETPGGELPVTEGFLLYGDTVSSEVTSAGPSAWGFIGIEGETIDVIARPLDDVLDIVIDILDESGVSILGGEVDEAFDTEEIRGVTLPSTGDFVIVLRGFADAVGPYELTITESSPIGGDLPAGGSLAYADTINSSVPAGAAAQWDFRGSAGDVIEITVEPVNEELDVVVDVLDANGSSILPNGEVDDAFGTELISGLALASDGVYTIVVTGFADSVGDFRLSLRNLGASGTTDSGLTYGDLVVGSVLSGDGSAWDFTGDEGDYIDITANPITEDFDLMVDVVDATGFSILDEGPVDESYDTEFIRVLRLPASGRYSVIIEGYDGAIGDYELSLDLTNGGMPGTILFAADTLEEADEEHSFPFAALAGEIVTILVDPETALDAVVGVYDDDMDEMLFEVDNTTGFEELIFEVPEDGNYYFLVSGYEGSTGFYEVTLLASDTVLLELALEDALIGRFGDFGYIEYMYRTLAGETISFLAETDEDIDLVISIVDADDNILFDVDDNFSGEVEELIYTAEAEELIYIRVSDFFEGLGEFFLTVSSG